MKRRTTRVVQFAAVILALLLGTATATALAKNGADDGPGATTGTTQTGTVSGTTPEQPAPARRVRVVGIVSAVDHTARTFTLKAKNRKPVGKARAAEHGRRHRGRNHRHTRTYTVLAGELTIPAVGRQVLVKGAIDGATITATRIKVLRGDDRPRRGGHGHHHGRHGDKPAGRGRGRGEEGRGQRGRHEHEHGDRDGGARGHDGDKPAGKGHGRGGRGGDD